jgi:hypothetical protein
VRPAGRTKGKTAAYRTPPSILLQVTKALTSPVITIPELKLAI